MLTNLLSKYWKIHNPLTFATNEQKSFSFNTFLIKTSFTFENLKRRQKVFKERNYMKIQMSFMNSHKLRDFLCTQKRQWEIFLLYYLKYRFSLNEFNFSNRKFKKKSSKFVRMKYPWLTAVLLKKREWVGAAAKCYLNYFSNFMRYRRRVK